MLVMAVQLLFYRFLLPIQEQVSLVLVINIEFFQFSSTPVKMSTYRWYCDSRCQYSLPVCSPFEPGRRGLQRSSVLDFQILSFGFPNRSSTSSFLIEVQMLHSKNDLQRPIWPTALCECVYEDTGQQGSERKIKQSVLQQLHSLSKHSGRKSLVPILTESGIVVRRLQSLTTA